MMFRKNKKDILNGNIPEQIMLFTIPICGSYLLQQLYQFADSIVLGRFVGVEAMAAVGGSASMIINILLNLISGIAAGLMIVVAQNLGKGDHQKVSDAVKTGIYIAVVFGGLISIISGLSAKPLLQLMNCPAETIDYSLIYMYSYFVGIIPYTIYIFGINILRASGDTKISILCTIIIAFVKIILDLILTAVLKIGVWGVSISTVVSYLICGIFVLIVLSETPNSYHYSIKEFGYEKNISKQIFKIGLPVAMQSALFAITNAYISVKINMFGTNAIAAFSSFNNVDNFYWSFTNSIGAVVVTIVGQNYGNKNMKRVKQTLKHGIIIHFIASILIGALEIFFGRYIIQLFTTNLEVINIATRMVQNIAITYSTYILVEMISSTIKGCGDSLNSMIIAFIGVCGTRLLFLTFFPFTNVCQVLYCYPISWTITSLIYLIYYLSNKKYRLAKDN